ncbi:hypothetical protein KSF78_0008791 [Schistosoma japonicum]|nr:hypothetical protein KSF78_0008791 [Schistosoma japonicum]
MQDTALYSISLLLLFIQASIQTDNTLGWKLQGMEEVITEVEVFINEAIEEFMAAFILLQNFITNKMQLHNLFCDMYSTIFTYNNLLGTHNIISWAINDIKTQIGKRE